MAHELVLAFTDQSPSFTHGFTCGRIWQEMVEPGTSFYATIQDQCRDTVEAMATAKGWTETWEHIGEGWARVNMEAPAQAQVKLTPHWTRTLNEREPIENRAMLIQLMEECAQAIVPAAKMLRAGFDEVHPEKQEELSYREQLATELGHIAGLVDVAIEHGIIDRNRLKAARIERCLSTTSMMKQARK